jgi:hypothetical protein
VVGQDDNSPKRFAITLVGDKAWPQWRAAAASPAISEQPKNYVFRKKFMKSEMISSKGLLILAIGLLMVAIGCGGGVKGNTYADNGNVVQIEFKSDGKAYMSMGPATNTCTYTESGKNVTLTCGPGETIAFTVDEDGGLNGPPGGMVSRLTKKK